MLFSRSLREPLHVCVMLSLCFVMHILENGFKPLILVLIVGSDGKGHTGKGF